MVFGLSEKNCRTIRQILQQYPAVARAMIYGSRAKGNYRNGSDIDLTLFGEALDVKKLLEIAWAFDESSLPHTVDVSLFDQISNSDLREHIQRVGKVLYERETENNT